MTHEPHWARRQLSGWGRASLSECDVAFPRDDEDALALMGRLPPLPGVARGNGRSYGDTALCTRGRVVCFSELNRIHSFDAATGVVVTDPGVTFADLLNQIGPRGWVAQVTPGTRFATVGGCIANDVHGKNHDRDGSFGDHVLWLDLLLPDGSVRRVGPEQSPELFHATIGGIGLTGFILRACFRMKRLSSARMRVAEVRVRDLDEYFDRLAEARQRYQYSVGWIDGLASGRNLGRGILELADHADGPPLQARTERGIRVPFDAPSHAINRLTVSLFNAMYYRRVPRRGRERLVDLRNFFYPLDALRDWNRVYGRRGFVQFQCALPDAAARPGIRALMRRISLSASASFLSVIKTLGGEGRGYLSFPLKGITLALDFPMRPGVPGLLDSLHEIVIEHGGRVYLAKDACLTPNQFERMYPRLPEFRNVLAGIDPQRRLRSDMSARLQL